MTFSKKHQKKHVFRFLCLVDQNLAYFQPTDPHFSARPGVSAGFYKKSPKKVQKVVILPIFARPSKSRHFPGKTRQNAFFFNPNFYRKKHPFFDLFSINPLPGRYSLIGDENSILSTFIDFITFLTFFSFCKCPGKNDTSIRSKQYI